MFLCTIDSGESVVWLTISDRSVRANIKPIAVEDTLRLGHKSILVYQTDIGIENFLAVRKSSNFFRCRSSKWSRGTINNNVVIGVHRFTSVDREKDRTRKKESEGTFLACLVHPFRPENHSEEEHLCKFVDKFQRFLGVARTGPWCHSWHDRANEFAKPTKTAGKNVDDAVLRSLLPHSLSTLFVLFC